MRGLIRCGQRRVPYAPCRWRLRRRGSGDAGGGPKSRDVARCTSRETASASTAQDTRGADRCNRRL